MKKLLWLTMLYVAILVATFSDDGGAAGPDMTPRDTSYVPIYVPYDVYADSVTFAFVWRRAAADTSMDTTGVMAAGCDSFDCWVRGSFGKGVGAEITTPDTIRYATKLRCRYDTLQFFRLDSLVTNNPMGSSGKRAWSGAWVYFRAPNCGYLDSVLVAQPWGDTTYVYSEFKRNVFLQGVANTMK